jgi:peptide deformylase
VKPNRSGTLSLVQESVIPQAATASLDDAIGMFVTALKMVHLCEQEKGIGLSAVQVGLPLDLFVVKREKGFEFYVNCRYSPTGEAKTISIEGCLSIRKGDGSVRRFLVERYEKVSIKGKRLDINESGEAAFFDVDFEEDGLYGAVFQHEIDHSIGVLISQIGEEIEVV